MGGKINLDGEDGLVLDLMNLMCLQNIQLKMSHRQAFIRSNITWKVLTIIQTRDDCDSD